MLERGNYRRADAKTNPRGPTAGRGIPTTTGCQSLSLVTPNAPIVFHNNLNSTLCRTGKQTRTARVRVVVAPMTHAQIC